MATLKTWPKKDAVRALITDEEMDRRISELGAYQSEVTLATYTGELTPDLLIAWAQFTHALTHQYPDAKVERDFTVKRTKSREELEDAVVSDVQSDRYYHPEKYADITSDEIKDS